MREYAFRKMDLRVYVSPIEKTLENKTWENPLPKS